MALDNKSHLMFEVKDEKVKFYILRVDKDQIEKVIKEAAIKFGERKETKSTKVNEGKYLSKPEGTVTENGVVISEVIRENGSIAYTSVGTSNGDIQGILKMLDVDLTVASFPPFTKELFDYLNDTSSVHHLRKAIAAIEKDENSEVQELGLGIKDAIHREELVECSFNDYAQTLYELSRNPDPSIANAALDLLERCVSPDKEINVESGEFIGPKKVKVGKHLESCTHR